MWCIISGIGGLYYQSLPDWNIKNALMHDLINLSWPITYDNGAKLVYYFGTFLPSSFVGKIFKFFGCSNYYSFILSNFTALFWALTGIVLVLLNVISYLNIKNKNPIWIVLVFIFFSGMDIILPISVVFMHIEWHPIQLQYSSITTMMMWAYNQAIAPWLITILFLKKLKEIEHYGILGTFSLFYAPLTFIGMSFYFCVNSVVEFFLQRNEIKKFFSKIFSIQNILCILFLIPIIYLFFKSNYTAEFRKIIFVGYNINTLHFLALECLLLMFFMWKKYAKNPIFYITLVSLILIPAFRLTDCLDFSMRVSVPAIFIMAIFVIKFLFEKSECKVDVFLKTVVGIFLFVGLATPACEIARGVYYTFYNNNQLLTKDYVQTLNNKITTDSDWVNDVGDYKNYGCLEPEKSLFFKYLSR
ncbi:hypothetical protein IKQ21_09155 [bacterium]|nr:hypothetical protein [bacterium]